MESSKIIQKINSILDSIESKEQLLKDDIKPILDEIAEDLSNNSKELHTALEIARTTLESSIEGIAVIGFDGNLKEHNSKFLKLWGFDHCIKHDLDAAAIYETIRDALKDPSNFQIQIQCHNDGAADSAQCHALRDGRFIEIAGFLNNQFGMIWSFNDVTEMKQQENKIRYQTEYDTLTGLPNQIIFDDRLQQAIVRSDNNYGARTAVASLDIDHIKKINDTLGRDHGDELIKEIAKRLQSCVREKDTICRTGGDEFLILIDEFSAHTQLAAFAQRILNSISNSVVINGSVCHTTASIGISVYPNDAKDGASLIKYANIALNKAKETGRNNYHFFTQYLERYTKHRVNIENHLHDAIKHQEFILQYQPVVNTKSQKIKGLEALVRWKSPTDGMIAPNSFIPIAEDTGLIQSISDIVIQEAFKQLKDWHNHGHPDLKMAVNLSAVQLDDKQLLERITGYAKRFALEPTSIILEITETMFLMNIDKATKILTSIREEGFLVALDDFGTGYSSLSYLRDLPIDITKLDRSFCHQLPNSKRDNAIAKNIINLINDLGLEIVAEGVERKDSLDFLIENDCHIIQGYYFSKPLSSEDATKFLNQSKLDGIECDKSNTPNSGNPEI